MKFFSPNTDSFVLTQSTDTKSDSSLFTPNKESFLLVRKSIVEIDSLSDTKTKSSPSLFTPNKESFLLVRKPIAEINSLSGTNIKSNASIFSPNTESFVLVRKSIDEINSLSGTDIKSNSSIFSPNTESFVLVRKSIDGINHFYDTENIIDLKQSNVTDNSKRKFLKAAGVVSAGVIASQLLPKKAEALIMGSSPTTGVVGVKNSANTRINPATEETLDSVLKTTDLSFDSGSLEVKVTGITGGSFSSFSDSGDVSKSALVDGDRHVQVDVLSSALPTSASTEETLETLSFGGVKYSLRLETVGVYDYIGEASAGTITSSAAWRIKRVDNTSGNIAILWADGDETFDNVWDNRASLTYA